MTDPCPDCPHRDATPSPRHAPDCPHWQPPARGPGSSDEARQRAMEAIRRAIEAAKQRTAGGTP